MRRGFRCTLAGLAVAASLAGAAAAQPVDDGSTAPEPGDDAAAAQSADDGSDTPEPGDDAALAQSEDDGSDEPEPDDDAADLQPADDGWDALERGDHAAAAEAFRIAADQGDVEAAYQLGAMYYEGLGLPQDYAAAAQWYQKAADGGDADAQYILGLMYSEGQGVPLDYAQAYERLNLAATLLDDAEERAEAAEARDAVGELMSPEELADARQRAGL